MEGNPSNFWAKFDQDDHGRILRWHPLMAHSADVAAMVEALLQRTILNKRIATIGGWKVLPDTIIARFAALAAIHDAGKVNHGFQNKAFDSPGARAGHVSPIIEVLTADTEHQERLLLPLGIDRMTQWFEDEPSLVHFLLATWGHHGKPITYQHDFKQSLWNASAHRDPQKGLTDLGDAIRAWFPQAFDRYDKKIPSNTELQHAYNGLLTLADWLGSDTRFFDYLQAGEDPIQRARECATSVVDTLCLDPGNARAFLGKEPVSFKDVAPWEAYEIQQKCMNLPLHAEGSLTVLESDTGSGKTEAALARFLRLYQAGQVDGMYFAVPTRSAATQLYQRIDKAMKRIFPETAIRPNVVQAVPGYIKVDDIEGKPLPGFRVLWDDERNANLRERGWAGEHPKRYLAGAIVVGTIDQVLLSTLQVKHAHMRSTALLRHFLVVDEIHASDTYMTRLLDRVLEHHIGAGGHALLMSATLGTAARLQFVNKRNPDLPSPAEASQISYPLITHADYKKDQFTVHPATSSDYIKKVYPDTQPIAGDPGKIARLAIEKARRGARVLIIRNKVADCIAVQQALENLAKGDEQILFGIAQTPSPHHSRFAPDDRRRLDDAIENTYGKGTSAKSVVACATQTVEQSLDIDADLLITDLCPIDVLLQRIGRLHRHKQDRPAGFEEAHCIVLTPENRDLGATISSEGKVYKGKFGLGTVYQDLRTLEASWRLLEDTCSLPWNIPKDNRKLVEWGTHPDYLNSIVEELGRPWEVHRQYLFGQEFTDRQLPDLVGIDFNKPFGESEFADDLGKVKTRLGRDDYQIYLPEGMKGPFGYEVKEMTITEWELDEAPDDPNIPSESVHPVDGGFEFNYYGRRFRYDRFGLSLLPE